VRSTPKCWLTDMDGVLVREEHALPGAAEFLERLVERERPFLVLTNNSIFTPRDLSARLKRSGLTVPEESIWTSALATATFLNDQLPGGSAYVIGEAGLTTPLHEVGYTLTDVDPDSEIAQEEVFGPVLVVIAYEDDDDAVRIANNSIYGLSGAVFGGQVRALAVARRIRTGTFSINGGNYFSPDSPFGGFKQSGIGREMGSAGLEEFLESKTFAEVVSGAGS